jgi:hypothetical protein
MEAPDDGRNAVRSLYYLPLKFFKTVYPIYAGLNIGPGVRRPVRCIFSFDDALHVAFWLGVALTIGVSLLVSNGLSAVRADFGC